MAKKIVFLFGAGAALDWAGPRTICGREQLTTIPEHGSGEIKNRPCCLTHLIRAIGFKNKQGESITDIIYQLLRKAGRNPNFESIINVLDDLYIYYALKSEQKDRGDAGLTSIFEFSEDIETLSYFETEEDSTVTHSYTLRIPGRDLLTEKYIPPSESAHQKYFELFINDVLGVIVAQISKYAYHNAREHSVIYESVNDKVNQDFYAWMNRFTSAGSTVRMYTLNYDRIFKILCQEKGMDVFEGFDNPGGLYAQGQYPLPNLQRIVSDKDCHCFYNLHGSAYWEVDDNENYGFSGYQYRLGYIGTIDRPTATIEIEKGKSILLSSIITGYQKVQRTALSPFRQLFSSFDRDCLLADEIYIVGYSFGDEHVNDIIRNAKKGNQQIKITVIDPAFSDEQFLFKFLVQWGPFQGGVYQNGADKEIISAQFNLRAISKRFGEFLAGTVVEQFGSWRHL